MQRLQGIKPELQHLAQVALSRSPVDFGIPQFGGLRTTEDQKYLYAQGRTRQGDIITSKDGVYKISAHQLGNAFDVYAYIQGKGASWDPRYLCLIAGVILATASELNIPIIWGGNWDGDGEIIDDQGFVDLPHFQLIR